MRQKFTVTLKNDRFKEESSSSLNSKSPSSSSKGNRGKGKGKPRAPSNGSRKREREGGSIEALRAKVRLAQEDNWALKREVDERSELERTSHLARLEQSWLTDRLELLQVENEFLRSRLNSRAPRKQSIKTDCSRGYPRGKHTVCYGCSRGTAPGCGPGPR